MNTENCIEYIKTGLGLAPERKLHIKMSLGPLILALLLGLVPGIVLKGAWLVLSMTLLAMSIAAVIAVAVISSKGMTVKNRLILQVIESLSFVLALCLVDVIFYTVGFGFNAAIAVIFIPPVLTPVLLGIMMYKKVNRDTPFTRKEMTRSTITAGGIASGAAGVSLSRLFFKDVDQSTVIIIVLVSTSLVNIGMSVGLLSIQRLYYLKKLNEQGISVE